MEVTQEMLAAKFEAIFPYLDEQQRRLLTRLIKALRERYPQVTAEHWRLVHGAIADQGGHEVDTEAMYSSSRSLARSRPCCVRLRSSAPCRPTSGQPVPIRVRIGTHMGNAVPAEGIAQGSTAEGSAARIASFLLDQCNQVQVRAPGLLLWRLVRALSVCSWYSAKEPVIN